MENIVFLDSATVIADICRPAFAHKWAEYPATTEEQVVARLRDATIAITNKVPVRRETLKQLPRLKMVAIAATGTDNVDIECCRECGIVVSNIHNYSVHTVPEHVFMLTLALRRNLPAYTQLHPDSAYCVVGPGRNADPGRSAHCRHRSVCGRYTQ